MLDDDGQVVSQVLKYQACFLLLRAIFLGHENEPGGLQEDEKKKQSCVSTRRPNQGLSACQELWKSDYSSQYPINQKPFPPTNANLCRMNSLEDSSTKEQRI